MTTPPGPHAMTAQAGAVDVWVVGHPTEPGIYRVRGFHIGHPEDFAVVEVVERERDGELLTNLHECNSDRHSWLRVSDLSERMQWQRVDTPAAVPVEALEGFIERWRKEDCRDLPGINNTRIAVDAFADELTQLIKERSNG